MRQRAIVTVFVVLLSVGGLGLACSSTTEENPGDQTPACDDDVTPNCDAQAPYDDGLDGTIDDATSTGDGTGDGATTDGSTAKPEVLYDTLADVPIVVDGTIVGCTPGSTQCTNCVDDDKDGFIDWMDPECTGPLDNDESSYATGIPGDNIDPCKQDCWFDGNSGSGDDGCLFNMQCKMSTATKDCPYDPKQASNPSLCPTTISDKCIKYCLPLTPKGCDCAGCCTVYDASGVAHDVKLVSTCDTEHLADPTKCPVCTKTAGCDNPCGKCDWCLGKTSLPAECYPAPDAGTTDGSTTTDSSTTTDTATDTGPPPTTGCPTGSAACNATTPCPIGEYCLTGCCIKPPA